MSPLRTSIALALLCLTGCALTSKSQPIEVRWYSANPVHESTAPPHISSGPALRIGRVTSNIDRGRHIAYGDGAYEVGYYEDRRWTERPEDYVRSSLDRTFFEAGRFQRALENDAPTLDIEVLSFQEIRNAETHAARIGLHVILTSDRVLFEDTIVVTEPATGATFDVVAAAMSRALNAASVEVAQRITPAMESLAAAGGRPHE